MFYRHVKNIYIEGTVSQNFDVTIVRLSFIFMLKRRKI